MKIKEGTEKLFEPLEVNGVKYNGYTSIVIIIATEWAERMEECIEAGQTVAECALQTMQAGTMGMDKWWYTVAVGFLAVTWIHGEALVDWNNAQYCATECPLKKENEEKV